VINADTEVLILDSNHKDHGPCLKCMYSRLSSLGLSTSWTIMLANAGGREVGVICYGLSSHTGFKRDLLCWFDCNFIMLFELF